MCGARTAHKPLRLRRYRVNHGSRKCAQKEPCDPSLATALHSTERPARGTPQESRNEDCCPLLHRYLNRRLTHAAPHLS